MSTETDLAAWRDDIARAVRDAAGSIVREVRVLSETTSTQDSAWTLSGGEPGMLVVADRQTSGRGRLGRTWLHNPGAGLAMTLTVAADRTPMERLSLVVGVAAAMGIEDAAGVPPLGLRWPNDVVERGGRGRKIAGVLVERRDSLALVGIGVNIAQHSGDFPDDLRERAMSVAMLPESRTPDRTRLLAAVLRRLDALLQPNSDALAQWAARDVLAGTECTFMHAGRAVSGRVTGIDPLNAITVETPRGERIVLPALTTSLIHAG